MMRARAIGRFQRAVSSRCVDFRAAGTGAHRGTRGPRSFRNGASGACARRHRAGCSDGVGGRGDVYVRLQRALYVGREYGTVQPKYRRNERGVEHGQARGAVLFTTRGLRSGCGDVAWLSKTDWSEVKRAHYKVYEMHATRALNTVALIRAHCHIPPRQAVAVAVRRWAGRSR